MSTCDMPGCPLKWHTSFSVFEEMAVWLCMVKPYDSFQKLMYNVLCFAFIDALNTHHPEETLRQSLMQYFLFYLNIIHIRNFSLNGSKFVSNKCFCNIDICQIRISSKGLLNFHSFILLSWNKLAWKFSYYWFWLCLNQLPKDKWLSQLYHPEFDQL